jgi:transcriptional regulator with XRE-family HTH domain
MMKGGVEVDQVKIGNFLKKLRKEKGITQEQLAEILNVSGRTVSRWETGNNMPDISILVDIADYQWRKEKRDNERKRKKNC